MTGTMADTRLITAKLKGIRITKKIHAGYSEWQNLTDNGANLPLPPIFGKYQYVYSYNDIIISCVELIDYWKDGKNIWEIYCIGAKKFPDIERYPSRKEAERRILGLLK